jgi:hypothetical protein
MNQGIKTIISSGETPDKASRICYSSPSPSADIPKNPNIITQKSPRIYTVICHNHVSGTSAYDGVSGFWLVGNIVKDRILVAGQNKEAREQNRQCDS